jgi:hypothetical protein
VRVAGGSENPRPAGSAQHPMNDGIHQGPSQVRPALAVAIAVAVAIGVSACGGLSTETTTSETNAAGTTTTSGGGQTTTTASTPSTTTTTGSSDAAEVPKAPSNAFASAQPSAAAPTTTSTTSSATTTGATTTGGTSTTAGASRTPPGGTVTQGAAAPTTTTGTAAAPSVITPLPGMEQLGGGATIGRFFSPSSPWNTSIQGDPTDPNSKELMNLARLRTAAIETPDGRLRQIRREIKVGLTINVKRWTVPIFSDQGGQPTPAVCRQVDCGPDAVTSVVMPADAKPQPRFDGWMTVINSQTRTALDFWRARRMPDGSISYHYVKKWGLDGPGFQEPGGVSARGSGLPLFAGLIRPDEIRSGEIDHALAISVPGAAKLRFVQPASRTDGNGQLSSLPEGARLRLKPDARHLLTHKFVRNGRERRAAGVIIDALERFGAIVVDRSAAPTLYAQRNVDWSGILPLNVVQDIPLSKFEVVKLPRVQNVESLTKRKDFSVTGLPPGTPGSIPSTVSGVETTQAPTTTVPPTTTTTPSTTTTTP